MSKLLNTIKLLVLVFILSLPINSAFSDTVKDITNTKNYLPGGKYRMFGAGRGKVGKVSNEIKVSGITNTLGNGEVSYQVSKYKGNVRYSQNFNNHGWEVHSPFTTSSNLDIQSKMGSVVAGGHTHLKLKVDGYRFHRADAYDGEQGGGYPEPTGAKDDYLYKVDGNVVITRISLDKLNSHLPKEKKFSAEERKEFAKSSVSNNPKDRENARLFEQKIIQSLDYVPSESWESVEISNAEIPSFLDIVNGIVITTEKGITVIKDVSNVAVGFSDTFIEYGKNNAELIENTVLNSEWKAEKLESIIDTKDTIIDFWTVNAGNNVKNTTSYLVNQGITDIALGAVDATNEVVGKAKQTGINIKNAYDTGGLKDASYEVGKIAGTFLADETTDRLLLGIKKTPTNFGNDFSKANLPQNTTKHNYGWENVSNPNDFSKSNDWTFGTQNVDTTKTAYSYKKATKDDFPPITSEGTANLSSYQKLKKDLAKQELDYISMQDSRLAKAVQGSGNPNNINFNIGSGTREEADRLGQIWVGDGARQDSGYGWISADGLRGYRPPQKKGYTNKEFNPTGTLANFERYEYNTRIKLDRNGKVIKNRDEQPVLETTHDKISDGHLIIID